MQLAYLTSVWLHILAATAWVGGMLFLVLVVVPGLRQGDRANTAAFLRQTSERFRSVGWVCFAVLVLTGSFNLWVRGVRFIDLTRGEWLASPFGHLVWVKLIVFATVLGVSAVHDFVLGPRAMRTILRDPASSAAQTERRRAALMGRLNLLLAFVLVALGVMIVRGVPD